MRESINSGLLFDLEKLDSEIKDLSIKSEEADFWNNRSQALEVIAKLNHSKEIADTYRDLLTKNKDLEELLSFDDESFLEQIESSLQELNDKAKEFELQILFTGEFDDLFIKRLFSSSSLSAIRVMSSTYLSLLIFLLAILIPACASSSPVFLMIYSA